MKKNDNNNWTAKDKTMEEISKLYGKRKQDLLSKESKAETHFEKILREQPEYYIREKAFYEDGFLCYVDFFFPFQNLAIEIDGKEHNNPKAQYRDKVKSEFLLKKRGTVTYRITNEECLAMTSIDIEEIAEKAWIDSGKGSMFKWRSDYMEGEYKEWMRDVQPRTDYDLTKPIVAYSKANDKVYPFANCYFMRKCTDMQNKDIIRNLENQENFLNATNFILAQDIETLSKRIVVYYNKIRRRTTKNHKILTILRQHAQEMDISKFDLVISMFKQMEPILIELRNTASASVMGGIDYTLTRLQCAIKQFEYSRSIVIGEQDYF